MNMNLYQVELPLEHPFTISRGTMNSQSSIYVELVEDGHSGWGEVSHNRYYGHTLDSIRASLEKVRPHLGRLRDQDPLEAWEVLRQHVDDDRFALSALDIAAHDLNGKRQGKPTWQTWGLEWKDVVPSSYTIGMDTIAVMVEKLHEQPDWPVYKIKLGSDNDLEVVRELRRHTEAPFRVDANCGWTADQTIENSRLLAELGVEFIEQPLPADAAASDKRRVFEQAALPVIADEDCLVAPDVAACRDLYHGVNVKICKCGGLSPALAMLRQAREWELKTMVGCMIESSVAISGAAQLLPLLDYADLDGAVLLRDEPATGVVIEHGEIAPPVSPGCGTTVDRQRLAEFS